MANNLTGNPLHIDSPTEVISAPGVTKIRLIQWIDDNADLVDNSDLNLTFNTTTFNIRIQRAVTPGGEGGTVYEAGPFFPGIPCSYLEVNAIDRGILLVWCD